jgi:hypothetical protein
MTQKGGNDSPTATVVDPRLAPHRLKTSLIPPDTGVFIRIDESPNIAETGRVFDLSEGGMYLIGRDGADIVLNDPQVSRKHAEIGLYGPEAYVLRDLASSNSPPDRSTGEAPGTFHFFLKFFSEGRTPADVPVVPKSPTVRDVRRYHESTRDLRRVFRGPGWCGPPRGPDGSVADSPVHTSCREVEPATD